MKLIIQIPCYNEEEHLEETIQDLPEKLNGIDRIETLVVDDGSTDNTRQVARECGVDHIEFHPNNKGLAIAFKTGINRALEEGADIIVNTDADNTFKGEEIEKLITPVQSSNADIVIGERKGPNRENFSWTKEILHQMGCAVVRRLSQTDLPDVTCGFRAYSREAALRLNVVSRFTYTLETIIQAGIQNLSIQSVPVQTNPSRRPSRLYSSYWHYVKSSINTIIRVYMMYRPLKFFGIMGSLIFSVGFLLGIRYIFLYFMDGAGHLQSLLLSAVLLIIGFIVGVIGLVSDLISSNRRLLQETLYLERKNNRSDEE